MIYGQPLCGQEWYLKHRHDYTQEDIDSLTIQVKIEGRDLPTIRQKDNRGKVANIVKINRKEVMR